MEEFTYNITDFYLCLATSKKGTLGIFDNELVGEILHDEVKFEIIRKFKSSRDMFPVKVVGFKVEELNEYLEETVNAEEFMGSRFNYNSRVKSNQSTFMRFINAE